MQLTFEIFKALAKFVDYDDRNPQSRIKFAEVTGSNGSEAIATDGTICAVMAIDDICVPGESEDEDSIIHLHSFMSIDPREVMGEMGISQTQSEDAFQDVLLNDVRHQAVKDFPDMKPFLSAKPDEDSVKLRFDINKLAAIVELLKAADSRYIDLVLNEGKPAVFANEDETVRGLIMPVQVRQPNVY